MDLSVYLHGDGLDVSRKHFVGGARHTYLPLDNFYSLRDVVKPETLDFIYSRGLINSTKFHRILIKEWFYAVKPGGKIIIEMRPNRLLGFGQMIKDVELLLGEKAKIIEKEYNKETGNETIVVQKTKLALEKGDKIEKWTFGILTNGKRDDVVDKTIKSIVELRIPQYEILICGEYANKPGYKIKNLNFNTEIPWITKKKNIICENAKYENIVVIHDRYIFDENWYEGMKKYGNYFEILSCVINDVNGRRTDDWMTFGSNLNDKLPHGNQGWLKYKDWDKNGYIDGGLYILKKSVWKKVRWNNSLMWNQGEDIVLSRDWYNAGFVARFNHFSKCSTIAAKHKWPTFEFNHLGLGKKIGEKWLNRFKLRLKSMAIFKKHYYALKEINLVIKKYYGRKKN